MAVGLETLGKLADCAFEVGRPGSLKLGFGLTCNLPLLVGGVGKLTSAGGRFFPMTEGSLKPDRTDS